MTQEDKGLLLKDLCARLLYGVVVHIHDINVDDYDRQLIPEDIDFIQISKRDCKPYLRPMSNMTEEEKEELKTLFDAEDVTSDSICYLEGGTLEEYLSHISYSFCSKIIDWLNKNHFDYRELIPIGLAIEVTEENNPYKD